MASLWRTQRPRFPQYISDGSGRDYYIKFNNAGYWEDQFKVKKKPDYEFPKYNNFHSLFHLAAPVKFIPTGKGRETYIINAGGFHHDQKPLSVFKLDDFLREPIIERPKKFKNKKHYMSVGEKRYNEKLQILEKDLVNRLYNLSIKNRKSKKQLDNENLLPNINTKSYNESDFNNNISNEKSGGERLNTLESLPSFKVNYLNDKKDKTNKMSLRNNLATILKQSQQIENYEMNNNSRRSDNESDYNIYRNGRVGCRINGLGSLANCQSEKWNIRINTEGNINRNRQISLERPTKNKLRKNNFTFSYGENPEEKKFKTIEY